MEKWSERSQKTIPEENFKLEEKKLQMLSIRVAEFLAGSTREGKK